MRKTLRNILACSLIGGSLLFAGCGKNEKYVLLSPGKNMVGEYNTKKEAQEVGEYNFGSAPFKVIEKSKIKEKREMPMGVDSSELKPYYSDTKENAPIQPQKKNYRSIHQLQRANHSKIKLPFNLEEFIFKCLPGKMLKDITFKKIDEDRTFYGKSYEDYIVDYKNGYLFYDLDKDNSPDVAAKFDEGRNRSATEILVSETLDHRIATESGLIGEIGTLHEIVYGDMDRDGILEMRVELTYDQNKQFQTLSRKDLSAY